MKKFTTTLLLLCSLAVQAQTDTARKNLNCDSAKTQADLNSCAANAYMLANVKLNNVYRAVLNAYKSDSAFISYMRASEDLWLQLRDVEVNVKFPHGAIGPFGSVQPMCASMYQTELTEQRISYLQRWMDGTQDGDVCGGSIRIKH